MSSELPCPIQYHLVYSVIDEGYTTWPFAAAGLFFVIVGLLALRFSTKALPNALRDGTATLVEGAVRNFSPELTFGHAPETFDVAAAHFAYQGVGGASAAFNRSKP